MNRQNWERGGMDESGKRTEGSGGGDTGRVELREGTVGDGIEGEGRGGTGRGGEWDRRCRGEATGERGRGKREERKKGQEEREKGTLKGRW